MRSMTLKRMAAGLLVALSVIHCANEDPEPTPTGGSAGSGGSGGSAGSAGSAGSTSGSAGTAGASGSGGAGGASGSGASGSGGAAGTGGSAGIVDGGLDVSVRPDAEAGPALTDASDGAPRDAAPGEGGAASFQAVIAIFNARCVNCHGPVDGGGVGRLVDLQTPAGLYDRLVGPLPEVQRGFCGVDGGGDGGGMAWHAIVPGNPAASLLYLKITGTQTAACGTRMPRVPGLTADGGMTTVACDVADGGAATNCLSQADTDTIRNWILGNAPDR